MPGLHSNSFSQTPYSPPEKNRHTKFCMAKQKHERFHMFTARELCAAARNQPASRCVHFNLHNPHLRKWIRPNLGINSPPHGSFSGLWAGLRYMSLCAPKVLFTIDAHDYVVLHCKKPNHLAILFKFPVPNITINI